MMSLYSCSGCSETIPPQKARLHCEYCANYDQCANCAILEVYRFTASHNPGHKTTLHRTSGYAPSPVNAESPPHPSAWGTMFDMKTLEPTASFIDLASALFDCIDSDRIGLVTPEAISHILDLVECPVVQNPWRKRLTAAVGPDREKEADDGMRKLYNHFSFDYQDRPRRLATTTSQTPCLTRRGFIQYWKADVLAHPNTFRNYTNIIFQNYQPAVWKERGDVPRHVFKERVTYEAQSAIYAQANQAPKPPFSQTMTPQTKSGWTDTISYSSSLPRARAPDRETAPDAQAQRQAEELRRAQAELEELEREKDRRLQDLERRHQLEYNQVMQRMVDDGRRSRERTREVMNEIGQDRDYVIERWYR